MSVNTLIIYLLCSRKIIYHLSIYLYLNAYNYINSVKLVKEQPHNECIALSYTTKQLIEV